MHTFAVSQFGNRLLPRRSNYKYANCIAYLFKANQPGRLDNSTFVAKNITRQDRDTYLECNINPGFYWLYIDMEWHPDTYKWLKGNLSFSVNCYGVGDVSFSENMADKFDQVEVLDHFMMAYTNMSVAKKTGEVKQADSDFAEVKIYEEDNYWKTGYNIKLFQNNSQKTFVASHSNLDFKNGLIILPTRIEDDYVVSRSQYAIKVGAGDFRGVYTKPYTGFQRGGQATTQKLVDPDDEDDVYLYYEEHHKRYQLSQYNVPNLNDDVPDPNRMPHDSEPVDDEGTAPPVKSGFKPKPVKSTKATAERTFSGFKVLDKNAV